MSHCTEIRARTLVQFDARFAGVLVDDGACRSGLWLFLYATRAAFCLNEILRAAFRFMFTRRAELGRSIVVPRQLPSWRGFFVFTRPDGFSND
jgi:hypothetical protein